MPGRTSVRASRKAAATAVEDSPPAKTTTKSRTTSSRTTTAPAVLQATKESEATTLRNRICSVFADAQRSNSTQRKLAVTLRKIQEACCYEEDKPSKRVFGDEEYDESDFNEEVGRCVLRVLGIKKSESVGDRLVRFLGVFLRLAGERDAAIFRADDPDNEDGFPETPTSRLTTHILSIALQVIAAKDKGIRYRATQIVAHIINTLDSIDDEVFQLVRLALLKRLRDKESNVRVQAVLGLGRLADEGEEQDEDEDSDDDDVAGGILRKLQDTLQHDPSADVRKALLLNLPFTPGTLPYLLERARDLDAATRRALYSRLLPALGDFRHLSLTHREKLLRWGLRDRDETVRKATARLFRERWIEDCARPQAQPEGEDGETQAPAAGPQQAAEPSMDALLELLERIDILNAGVETGIAHEAMAEFWAGRPDYLDYMTFEDPYFTDNLTPESSFIARSFNEHCRTDTRLAAQAEDKMPEVTKFAFVLQQHLVKLIELVQEVALNPDDVDNEEDAVQQEFCVEQLLHISLTLDYSDEMGRRKMFSVLREALAIAELPEECTKLVVECLRVVCGKTTNTAAETEFCSVVLEAVAEVHDTIMGDSPSVIGDESFHSARSEVDGDATPTKTASKKQSVEAQEMDDEEKAVREIMVNMKCLHIAQCMLQNVQSDLEKNSHLVTMLNSLVVPAVRSQEAPVRERGLICLGLCCLLAKNLAEENLMLFIHCFTRGHPALQVIALQIITDILIAHPCLLAEPAPGSESPLPNQFTKPIQKIYLKALRSSEEPQVQSTSATALSKLLLAGIFRSDNKDDTDLLKQMVLSYFDPDTAGNPSLRQAMTYFLPVYCHTRTRNAVAMANIAIPVLRSLAEIMEDLVDDGVDQDMVGLSSVAAQICDWTDPRKAYNADQALPAFTTPRRATAEDDLDGHVVLASELLDKILAPGCSKEDRKLFISMLGKLHIDPDKTSIAALQHLVEKIGEAVDGKVAAEVSSRNTLTKLHTILNKALAAAIEGQDDEATTTGHTRSQSRDIPIDTTEVADTTTADTTTASVDDETLIQAQLAAEAGAAADHSTLDSPITSETESTMLTRFTGAPDAEGTVFGDFDDEDDEEQEEEEDDSTEVGNARPMGKVSIPIRGSRPSAGGEESLLDSLLEDESDDGIE